MDFAPDPAALLDHARNLEDPIPVSVYPWDILTQMEERLQSPQAMLLVVPNGKVKLLNALPFAPADLKRDSLETAWDAYRSAWRSPEVRERDLGWDQGLIAARGRLQHALPPHFA